MIRGGDPGTLSGSGQAVVELALDSIELDPLSSATEGGVHLLRIDPNEFAGPRAYFTAFDPRIVERASDQDQLQRDCERRLKLLLLLKARVVCAASHLQSPVAHRIFSKNPFLLQQGHVIPALRDSASTIRDAFRLSTDSTPGISPDVAKFYDEHVATVVIWNLEENSSWFCERFTEELRNPQSVVRLNARGLTHDLVSGFVALNAGKPLLDRQLVEQWADTLPHADREVVLAFRELIYHVSGARVVNCEGSLPQENYLDFDLADLSQKRTRLSDDMVFWKLFVEQALTALQMRALPVEVLDLLDFGDVITIREPLQASDFQEKYDELTRAAIAIARDGAPRLVENVERLEKIRASLERTFKEVFDRELLSFIRQRRHKSAPTLATNSISVALGLLGFVPVIGPFASALSTASSATALYFNVASLRATPQSLLDVLESRENAVRALATRRPSEDALMFDVVDLLSSTIRERITLK